MSSRSLVMMVFAFLLSQSPAARAEECSAISYRESLGPARDQGESELCFAYATADLISQKLGQRISAAGVAAVFALHDPSELKRLGGEELHAFQAAHPDWIQKIRTDQSDESKGLMGISGGEEDSAALMANLGLCLEEDLNSTGDNGFTDSDLKQVERLARMRAKELDQGRVCRDPLPEGAEVTIETLRHEVRETHDPVADDAAREWLHQRCELKKPRVDLVPDVLQAQAGSPMLKRAIDHALEHGRIVAIGYDWNMLAKNEEPTHATHSSSIVARRMRGGKCEYLLRDSFGGACELYKARYRKSCLRDPGHIWLSEVDLLRTTFSVVSLR